MELQDIQHRHDTAEVGYQSFKACHDARPHSTATLESVFEYSIHCDRGWLIARVGELEILIKDWEKDYKKIYKLCSEAQQQNRVNNAAYTDEI